MRPGGDSAFANAQGCIWHQGLRLHLMHHAHALACGTGALRVIGGKRFGSQKGDAVRPLPGARIEQSERYGNARQAADGGALLRARAALLQRNRWRQAIDAVYVRGRRLIYQAARMGRDRFHKAPLRLCIERVERQRRLARSRNAGENHHGVTGKREGEIFKVMRSCALNAHAAVVAAMR